MPICQTEAKNYHVSAVRSFQVELTVPLFFLPEHCKLEVQLFRRPLGCRVCEYMATEAGVGS